MKLDEAKEVALLLMAEHGLTQSGWKFRFDRAVRRAGCCHFRTREISVSQAYAETQHEDFVWNTILHEIAHALVGPKAGHGPEWRAVAVRIGCDGRRGFVKDDVVDAPSLARTWRAACPSCGQTVERHRRPRNAVSCAACCRAHNRGKFDPRFVFTWERIDAA